MKKSILILLSLTSLFLVLIPSVQAYPSYTFSFTASDAINHRTELINTGGVNYFKWTIDFKQFAIAGTPATNDGIWIRLVNSYWDGAGAGIFKYANDTMRILFWGGVIDNATVGETWDYNTVITGYDHQITMWWNGYYALATYDEAFIWRGAYGTGSEVVYVGADRDTTGSGDCTFSGSILVSVEDRTAVATDEYVTVEGFQNGLSRTFAPYDKWTVTADFNSWFVSGYIPPGESPGLYVKCLDVYNDGTAFAVVMLSNGTMLLKFYSPVIDGVLGTVVLTEQVTAENIVVSLSWDGATATLNLNGVSQYTQSAGSALTRLEFSISPDTTNTHPTRESMGGGARVTIVGSNDLTTGGGQLIDGIAAFIVPAILIMAPAVVFGFVAKLGIWGWLIGALIDASLGCILMPTIVPIWLVVALVVAVGAFAYSSVNRGG